MGHRYQGDFREHERSHEPSHERSCESTDNLALGIDLDTAFGSDLFGEMHALFGQQRSAMRYRRFRGEANVPAPISVEAVLEAATVNGARAAGLEGSIGTLTPGKQADIIMVRTDGVGVFRPLGRRYGDGCGRDPQARRPTGRCRNRQALR
jgi:cytosine/adenosine deaminase-related metal-dependent hydrolase